MSNCNSITRLSSKRSRTALDWNWEKLWDRAVWCFFFFFNSCFSSLECRKAFSCESVWGFFYIYRSIQLCCYHVVTIVFSFSLSSVLVSAGLSPFCLNLFLWLFFFPLSFPTLVLLPFISPSHLGLCLYVPGPVLYPFL